MSISFKTILDSNIVISKLFNKINLDLECLKNINYDQFYLEDNSQFINLLADKKCFELCKD